VVAIGLTAGMITVLALGRVLEKLLFQTDPRDPHILVATVVVVLVASVSACLISARRAARIDPIQALREG